MGWIDLKRLIGLHMQVVFVPNLKAECRPIYG
jgi:hypothetical protein